MAPRTLKQSLLPRRPTMHVVAGALLLVNIACLPLIVLMMGEARLLPSLSPMLVVTAFALG